MWDWIINLLTSILSGIQGFCGDWGLAVIILTVIIRLLLVPLTNKQTASMARMQVVQPKLKEIQESKEEDIVSRIVLTVNIKCIASAMHLIPRSEYSKIKYLNDGLSFLSQ